MMPVLFPRKSSRRKKRVYSEDFSIDYLRATGNFNKTSRPKSDVISATSSSYAEFVQDSLDVPSPGNRNVKTAPSTPDVESRGFSSRAESTGQIDMAAAGMGTPGGGTATSSPTSPTVTTTTSSSSSRSTSKHQHRSSDDRPNSMDSSGQKSPHKEVSPKMSKSRNEKFHRLFKCVPEDEHLYNTYSCAFFGDILLQGYLYISQNWFCFYSKILGHEKLIEIPVASVINITREKTAFIIPNAIGIRTTDEKYVFGSLLSRDSTFKLMRRIWEQSDAEPLPQGKETDDDISENNNNVECDDSNSGNEINTIPQSPSSAQIPGDSSCESSESDNRLLCQQCGDTMDFSDHEIPRIGGPDVTRTSMRGHHHHHHHASNRQHPRNLRPGSVLSWHTISRTANKLQRMPRTNLLLLVCTGLALFLLLSAMVLTYKVVALQARLDMVATPSSQWSNPTYDNDVMNKDAYYLNSQYHAATVERFHNVIRANIHVLGQVHESLRNLHDSAEFTQCGPGCSNQGEEKTHKDP